MSFGPCEDPDPHLWWWLWWFLRSTFGQPSHPWCRDVHVFFFSHDISVMDAGWISTLRTLTKCQQPQHNERFYSSGHSKSQNTPVLLVGWGGGSENIWFYNSSRPLDLHKNFLRKHGAKNDILLHSHPHLTSYFLGPTEAESESKWWTKLLSPPWILSKHPKVDPKGYDGIQKWSQ